jgi:hypothetical protein
VRLLSEFGFQQGQLALGRGNGRGGALSGGKGRSRGDAISGAKGAGGIGRGAAFGQRVPTATAPTAAVISGAEKGDKAAGAKKTMADMSTKDKEHGLFALSACTSSRDAQTFSNSCVSIEK